ncbi:MAG: Cell division protein FtsA [Firmicutes bacterium ADurb.Bin182]|nr:MAG: Cell division protein FtsA [Firmicutes bacterium ADurb.Bin182]
MKEHTVLDIGSSKIVGLNCSAEPQGNIVVHGAAIKEYKGYRHKEFLDEPELQTVIAEILEEAETDSKHRLRDITVGVPGPFLHTEISPAEIRKKNSGIVRQKDVDQLMNDSLSFDQPEGYELIHSTPIEFKADGVKLAGPPAGVRAQLLTSPVSHVYVDAHFRSLVDNALASIGLQADMFVGVPLSEGLFLIPDEERLYGAVLIDVGYTHTDISLLFNAALIKCITLEVGGMHFKNDLVYGLNLLESTAENIKRRYVYSLDYQDSIDNIRIPGGGTIKIDYSAIQYILEARTKELADMIYGELTELNMTEAPVYLTGGGISLMRGSCEFLEKYMGIPIKVRMPWMPRLSSPNYASAFGTMSFMLQGREETIGWLHSAHQKSFLNRIIDFFAK